MTEIHKFASLMESGGHLGSVDTRNEPVYINNDSINNINNNNSTPGCKWASIHQKVIVNHLFHLTSNMTPQCSMFAILFWPNLKQTTTIP